MKTTSKLKKTSKLKTAWKIKMTSKRKTTSEIKTTSSSIATWNVEKTAYLDKSWPWSSSHLACSFILNGMFYFLFTLNYYFHWPFSFYEPLRYWLLLDQGRVKYCWVVHTLVIALQKSSTLKQEKYTKAHSNSSVVVWPPFLREFFLFKWIGLLKQAKHRDPKTHHT